MAKKRRKEPHGEDEGQQVQVALGKVSSLHKRNFFFYSQNNLLNHFLRDVVEFPSLELVKT